jgi:hypothetical protein
VTTPLLAKRDHVGNVAQVEVDGRWVQIFRSADDGSFVGVEGADGTIYIAPGAIERRLKAVLALLDGGAVRFVAANAIVLASITLASPAGSIDGYDVVIVPPLHGGRVTVAGTTTHVVFASRDGTKVIDYPLDDALRLSKRGDGGGPAGQLKTSRHIHIRRPIRLAIPLKFGVYRPSDAELDQYFG